MSINKIYEVRVDRLMDLYDQIEVMQGSKKSIDLKVYVTENGQPIALTTNSNVKYFLEGSRPDGSIILEECTRIENKNCLVFESLPEYVTLVNGSAYCHIVVYDYNENKKYNYTYEFLIFIRNSKIDEKSLLKNTDFSYLAKVVLETRQLIEEITTIVNNYSEIERSNAELKKVILESESIRVENEDLRLENETTRKVAETVRSASEATRETKEDARISAENTRISAENTRKTAENTRISAENTRKSAESTRVINENKRIDDESKRNTTEQERVKNESSRIDSESSRVTNEIARIAAEYVRNAEEIPRQENENVRKTEELTRKSNETSRIESESTRTTQENTRKSNENSRISSENTRRTNEENRIASENIRVQNETSRGSSETTRVIVETARVARESTRETNEDARVSAEDTRISQENSRKTAENTRSNNESVRVKNEENRIASENDRSSEEQNRRSDESSRKVAETARVASESTRKTNETSRGSSETARVIAETARVAKESTRETNEDARVSAENIRISAESTRVSAENTRISQENSRKTAENTRSNNESVRVKNEENRIASESIRVQNETVRIDSESERFINETARIASEITREKNETIRQSRIKEAEDATQRANVAAALCEDISDGIVGISDTMIDNSHTFSNEYVNNKLILVNKELDSLKSDMTNCFQSVSDGKILVANAITDKGVITSADATFATMATNIQIITTGIMVTDTTATKEDVLVGKYFYTSKSVKSEGGMANLSGTVLESESSLDLTNKRVNFKIPTMGKYNTDSYLYNSYQSLLNTLGVTANKIAVGQSILDMNGTFSSDATAIAREIIKDKTVYVNGVMVTGTMENRFGYQEALSRSLSDGTYYYIVPKEGYYSGTVEHTVSVNLTNLAQDIGLTADKILKGNTVLGIVGTGGKRYASGTSYTTEYVTGETYSITVGKGIISSTVLNSGTIIKIGNGVGFNIGTAKITFTVGNYTYKATVNLNEAFVLYVDPTSNSISTLTLGKSVAVRKQVDATTTYQEFPLIQSDAVYFVLFDGDSMDPAKVTNVSWEVFEQ